MGADPATAHEAKQGAYAAQRRAVTGPQLAAYDKAVAERLAQEAAVAVPSVKAP